MNYKTEVIKGFDTVQFFRDIKEKISVEIEGMSFEQVKTYFEEGSKKFQEVQACDARAIAANAQ